MLLLLLRDALKLIDIRAERVWGVSECVAVHDEGRIMGLCGRATTLLRYLAMNVASILCSRFAISFLSTHSIQRCLWEIM